MKVPNSIRLVALDLDGTVLREDLQVSERTKEVVRAVRRQGVSVAICTGRMFATALPYAQELGLDLPLITYQGALVKSLNGEVLYRREVPLELARQVVLEARANGFAANMYMDDLLHVEYLTPQGEKYIKKLGIPFRKVDDLLSLLGKNPTKLLVLNEEEKIDAFAQLWREKYGDSLYVTKSLTTYLEFLHPEATKGRGLAALADYLGIPREQVMAVGDSWNDLEMFKYAGLSVAMGNGPADVRAMADYVTKSNDDDGVALAMERFILNCA
ncbi:MAG: Cof-type HAD-IIB family hydrolase [Bacillota bacterium]